MTEHSKLPWRLNNYHFPHAFIVFDKDLSEDNDSHATAEGRVVCIPEGRGKEDGEMKANAAFIVEACNAHAKLKAQVAELEQHRHGHLPSCGGADPARHECDCGYLQGYAYRDLKAQAELLEGLLPLVGELLSSDIYADAEGVIVVREAGYDDDSYQVNIKLIDEILQQAKELSL